MIDLTCPACGAMAVRQSGPGGIEWHCPQCGGVSSTISQLRKYVPRDIVNSLWNAAKQERYPRRRRCPSCNHRMTDVPVPWENFSIDVCSCCAFVWFDAGENNWLPDVPAAPVEKAKPLPPELAQRIALDRIRQMNRHARENRQMPEEAWKYIPALLGVPVEFDCEECRRTPYATWILMVIITAISLFGFLGILSPADFGLIPAEWGRMAGLTFFTSFFLHGGISHLVGNLYYLYVFGDNVEDVLGRARFLFLLAASTLIGGLLYVLMKPGSPVACIGASGGISGILAYYALRFPKHRIGVLLFFFKWIRFPVTVYFAFWIAMQLFGILTGAGRVAYAAHLGGVLAGVAYRLAEWIQEKRA
ncbi:MAG: rhomboid family intramembrane serine protease [Kiritimatiellales bacterium]